MTISYHAGSNILPSLKHSVIENIQTRQVYKFGQQSPTIEFQYPRENLSLQVTHLGLISDIFP